jgi:hypothetical protein
VGDNGAGVVPNCFLSGGGQTDSGSVVLDDDPSDGFDSGPVGVQLSVGGDQATLTVSGATSVSLSINGLSLEFITGVEISAGVLGPNCLMEWSALSVTFTGPGGEQVQNVYPLCNPVADSAGGPPGEGASRVLGVTPGSFQATGVSISGTARMRSSGNQLPGANAIAGSFFVSATEQQS